MEKRTRLSRALARFGVVGLIAGVWVLGADRASGDAPPDDGVPRGAVAFFAGAACPTGWAPSEDAKGRLIVGATDEADVGVKVGTPLADREDRTHAHGYSGMVSLKVKNIAGADGANDNGAQSGPYAVTGMTAESPSGLGFVQVLVCVKM